MKENQNIDLVKRAQKQDPDAFTELIETRMKSLYRAAIAILENDEDAADAIQDTIISCWEKLGTLKKPQYFRTWIMRILINKCYDLQRKKKLYVPIESQPEPQIYDEYNIELKEALAFCGEKYGLILTLYYGEGYKIREISDILDIPAATVQTRLRRARMKLAEYYGYGHKGKADYE